MTRFGLTTNETSVLLLLRALSFHYYHMSLSSVRVSAVNSAAISQFIVKAYLYYAKLSKLRENRVRASGSFSAVCSFRGVLSSE